VVLISTGVQTIPAKPISLSHDVVCNLVPKNKISNSLCRAAIWNLSDNHVIVELISDGGLGRVLPILGTDKHVMGSRSKVAHEPIRSRLPQNRNAAENACITYYYRNTSKRTKHSMSFDF